MISELEGLTNLQTLNLSNIEINDISVLEELTNLQVPDLSALKELTNLQNLNLYNTQISDSNIQELKEALPKCNI